MNPSAHNEISKLTLLRPRRALCSVRRDDHHRRLTLVPFANCQIALQKADGLACPRIH